MAFPTGWSDKLEIQSDATKVSGSSNLTNFPALISDSNLTSAVYAGLQADADDLRITTDSAGTTEIPFEIVSFNQGAETCEIWAKVPTLEYDANTSLYIWYGNASALPYSATDTYGSQAVWSSAYKTAYHFEPLTSDSTSNAKTLTNVSSAVAGTGQIGDGVQNTTTPKYLWINSDIGVLGNGSTSLSFWVNLDADITTDKWCFFQHQVSTGTARYLVLYYEYNAGTRRFAVDASGTTRYGNANLGTGWNHISVVRTTTTNVKLYLNGTETVNDTPGTSAAGGSSLQIGTNGAKHTPGIFDQFTVTNTALTSDWITTEYNNQNSPSTFWSAVSGGYSLGLMGVGK